MKKYKFDPLLLFINLFLFPVLIFALILDLIEGNSIRRKVYWTRHLPFFVGFVYQYPEDKS